MSDMHDYKTIFNLYDYGKITVNLKALLTERGMTRNQLARSADTRFEVVNKWYSGTVERIDADILARFCYVLDCDVADLIKYEK